MAEKRDWSYPGYAQRSLWLDLDSRCEPGNRNPKEAAVIVSELNRFERWARGNPHLDEEGRTVPWEVAILAFYRGQERVIRQALRKATGNHGAYRTFELRSEGRVAVRVELCTVDRFQGHEADVVFLSVTKTHVTNFLESVNRLNVALTRARYQRVLVGNRKRLRKKGTSLLQQLATSEPWGIGNGGES